MVGFKGRVKFKQYCKNKPTKWGLKVFTLAKTGYIYNTLPYTGRETLDVIVSQFSHLNMTGQIVTHLMTPLLDRGQHLFADRYYSGVNLVTELYRRNTGFTGTIMPNRVKLPPAVRGLKLEKGDIYLFWHGTTSKRIQTS